MVIDECTKQDARERHEQHIRAADDSRRQYRLRFQIYPERQTKPQKTRGHIRDQRIDEHLIKVLHVPYYTDFLVNGCQVFLIHL